MGTRSTIAVQLANGTVRQIYCHWDGYLSHNGKLLMEHYNSQERAELVTSDGSMSVLAPVFAPTGAHSFNKPQEGVCVLYGRDRNESDVEPQLFDNVADYRENHQYEEFEYLYSNGMWLVCHDDTDGKYVLLEDALTTEEA